MSRRTWFDLHSWFGLNLSLLLSFVLVTGTLATVSTELDWVANSASRVYRLSTTKSYDWASLYTSAQAAYPDAELLSISAPADPWFAVVAVAVDANRERFRIFLDPETSQVQGEGRWYNWQRFFRQTHRHLMLPINVGVTIVGLLSVPLLVAFCSGTVIYQKWWRGFFVNPLSNAKSPSSDGRSPHSERRLWGNVHRWLAIWSLWFILLIATTGIWYLGEQWGLQVNYSPLETADTEASRRNDSTLSPTALSAMTSQAARLYPELDVTNILLPHGDDRLVRIQGESRAILVRDRANQITFDTPTGRHVNTRKGIDLSAHMRISEAADPLHFGYFGGTATRFVWFLFGTMLSGLSITGVYLYGLRTVRSLGAKKSAPQLAWVSALRGMGYLKWPSVFVLVICIALAIDVFLLG